MQYVWLRAVTVFFRFFILVMVAHNAASAQTKERTFKPYLVGGFNTSQIEGDDMSGFSQYGANGGGGVYFKFKPNWSISTEILYSMRGSNGRPYINGYAVDSPSWVRINMDYAEVPVFVSYHDKKYAMFGLGLSLSGLVRYEYYINNKNNNVANTPAMADFYKRYDLSFLGNVTFFIGKRGGFNLRWSYSLVPITKETELDPQHHNVIALRGMFLF